MSRTSLEWKPDERLLQQVDEDLKEYRDWVKDYLSPLVRQYCPELITKSGLEFPKMLELSTKMTMVGKACTQIAGHTFDERRLKIGSLFGACCFLGDSFLDDFGAEAARDYLRRYELLLTRGWFEIHSNREELLYVILSRLFRERDVLEPMLRQAIFSLYLAQRRDVTLRIDPAPLRRLPRREKLDLLKECARNKSGHAILVLTLFLVPDLLLRYHHLIYTAGALIMFIDDHGDCHYDRYYGRTSYMNQVKDPVRALGRIFTVHMGRLLDGLPESPGRDLLTAFLYKYYVTRLKKHMLERDRGASSWTVYE
jgi:hypothetical protein